MSAFCKYHHPLWHFWCHLLLWSCLIKHPREAQVEGTKSSRFRIDSGLQQIAPVPNISFPLFPWQLWIKYSLFTQVLSAFWCVALFRFARQSSERVLALRFLMARVQPWWIAPWGGKVLISGIWKGGGLESRESQELIEPTYKGALHPQSWVTVSS